MFDKLIIPPLYIDYDILKNDYICGKLLIIMKETYLKTQSVSFEDFKKSILDDYKLGRISRELSLLGRREVLTGKAKFGIFGDGKELPQIAMAKVFREGDWRSGYYRDQTLALAVSALSPQSFFAQLYADTDTSREPATSGRQMNDIGRAHV